MVPQNTDKEQSTPDQLTQKQQLDLAVSSPLPGNRPIVPTNKDPEIDEFVGYMD